MRFLRAIIASSLLCLPATVAAQAPTLPPAHPPVSGALPTSPHGGGLPSIPVVRSERDPSLQPGELVVTVVTGDGAPLSGATVTLREVHHSIAEGDSKKQTAHTTGADGTVRFSSLDTSLQSSAEVSVRALGASYEVEGFRPSDSAGQRVTVPVFPSSSDPKQAMIGMRGFIYVQLREGEFWFDVLYRVFSLSGYTWVPRGVELDLPAGATGFDGQAGFSLVGQHAELGGSYPPGQKDVRMTFRVPAPGEPEASFSLDLPPHLVELRVISEFAPGMSLDVPGFDPAEETAGPAGTPVLFTRRTMSPGEPPLARVAIRLRGLPTVGPERWYVAWTALGLAGLGLYFAWQRRGGRTPDELEDVEQARELLLGDLKDLERARSTNQIGPETYERVRRELLLSLARLEEPSA